MRTLALTLPPPAPKRRCKAVEPRPPDYEPPTESEWTTLFKRLQQLVRDYEIRTMTIGGAGTAHLILTGDAMVQLATDEPDLPMEVRAHCSERDCELRRVVVTLNDHIKLSSELHVRRFKAGEGA